MKNLVKIIALCMSFVFMFSTAVSASELESSPIGDPGFQHETIEQDMIQPRYPGRAGIYCVRAYAGDSSKGIYYTGHSTYAEYLGKTQACGFTLDQQTRSLYESNNCDSIYVEFAFIRDGAEYFELFVNEEKIKRQSLGSLPAGSCDLFRFSVPVKEGVAQWKVVLYNYGDKEGAGMPLSTTVKIK